MGRRRPIVGGPPHRVPTRTCVACRTSRGKRELVRIVRTPDGRMMMDPSGRLAGRGAYLCADPACRRIALDKHILSRALGVPLPDDLRTELEAGIPVRAGSTPALRSGVLPGASPTMNTSDGDTPGGTIGQE